MKILELNWDSNFFGYKVGKVEIKDFHAKHFEDFLRLIKRADFRLIYIYPLDQLSRNTLLRYNIPKVNTKVVFEKMENFSQISNNNIMSYDSIEQYETIEKLALLSGEYSRFKTDIHFSNNEFFRLYTEWINKSISKEIATDIIVYKEIDKIKGFVSYKITPIANIIIGLIAVDSAEQGKGIGKILMGSIEKIAFQNGMGKIIVSTQLENKQAMRFYYSCGYTLKTQQDIFHLWIP